MGKADRIQALPAAALIGLSMLWPASGWADPAQSEGVPEPSDHALSAQAEPATGGISAQPLDPTLGGNLPGERPQPALAPTAFGAALGLLNTGGRGETVPPPYIGGD